MSLLRNLGGRAVLQMVGALAQVTVLVVFAVYLPTTAVIPVQWASDYFLALAVLTPIFMFFGFELRKMTAASQDRDPSALHRARVTGLVLSLIVGLFAYACLQLMGMDVDGPVFAVVVIFKVVMGLHDQVLAEYERQDRFVRLAASSLLKAAAFLLVAVATAPIFGPTNGALAATLAMGLLLVGYDIPENGLSWSWLSIGPRRVSRDMWLAGFGSLLVSSTLNTPRILAAAILGDAALVILGVGQSLNRFGQILSGSLTQALIVLRKRAGFAKDKALGAVLLLQIMTALILAAALPLWGRVFSYAKDLPEFSLGLILIIAFGLLSQANYLLQSLTLVSGRVIRFILGPTLFHIIFLLCLIGYLLTGYSTLSSFIVIMIIPRLAQLLYNTARLTTRDDP